MTSSPSRDAIPPHPPALGSPPRPRVPVPDRWVLDSGLRVVAIPRRTIPQVAMRLVLPAGAAADPDSRAGLAAMVGNLLTEGTQHHSAEDLNARLDSLGAAVSARIGHDFAEIDAVMLTETTYDVVSLLAELIREPSFPDRETERIRAETLDALEARGDEPANVADDRTAAELFGNHPYARLSMGTPEGLAEVTRTDLLDFHASRYRPDGSFLVAAGDFDPDRLRELLEASFTGWRGTAPAIAYPQVGHPASSAAQRIDVPWQDATQAEIRIASSGIERGSAHWVTASVANYILGGSTITGRLGANLREDKGWTYGARSGLTSTVQPGGWVAETAVDIEVANEALEEMLREIDRMGTNEVAKDELRRAQDALVLSLPRAFETPGSVVGRFATVEAFGLAEDYWRTLPDRVRSVTAEDVLNISRIVFDPEGLVRVVVGTQPPGQSS